MVLTYFIQVGAQELTLSVRFIEIGRPLTDSCHMVIQNRYRYQSVKNTIYNALQYCQSLQCVHFEIHF